MMASPTAGRRITGIGLLLASLILTGCVSKAASQARVRAAYEAGRASAYRQMQQEEHRTNVRVIGNVRNPEIPWEDGLTLAQVMVKAECLDKGNPGAIVIVRQGQRFEADVKALLKGEDLELEPGDIVEVHP